MDTKEQAVRAFGPAARLSHFFIRFGADRSGVAAVFFAVVLLLLIPLTLGLVNVYLSTSERAQLQDALDAAALYVARTNLTDAQQITDLGTKILNANMGSDKTRLTNVSFKFDKSVVVADAKMTASTIIPSPFTNTSVGAHSEVTRNSVNLEVAIVLDTTGSMSGAMTSLKSAAKELVKLVVNDQQTPYYSKASLIPYSAGVNVGTYANTVRSAVRGATTITGVSKSGSQLTVTSAGHGLSDGEWVLFTGVKGMTQLNNNQYVVANQTNNTFKLKDVNNNYVSSSAYSNYTSAGSVQCLSYGCEKQRARNANNSDILFNVTACATERTGNNEYTDAAPSTTKVNLHYVAASNAGSNTDCNDAAIQPLTSDRTVLTNKIDSLVSDGFTAGHIGLAWGWYSVAPNWGTVFTGASEPASYTKPETVKVVVLMTDGAFNTAYCNGIISNDSTESGSYDQAKCNSPNGDAFSQAKKLCTNIKAQKIVVYTVGFNIGNNSTLETFLKDCATDPVKNYYKPATGAALTEAFKAIGQDISKLRISR